MNEKEKKPTLPGWDANGAPVEEHPTDTEKAPDVPTDKVH